MVGPKRPVDALAEIAGRAARLPAPVAVVAEAVGQASDQGDRTGVVKRCYELGGAVVRYGVSVALALLHERLDGKRAPKQIGIELGRAARLSDGKWCALLRQVSGPLRSDPDLLPLFAFAWGKPLADLVKSRNEFAHAAGSGRDAPGLASAVLVAADALLAPLGVALELELRHGVLRLSPWLPTRDGVPVLIDAPHAGGGMWRSLDGASGEHREAPELSEAVRALIGEGTDRPVPMGDEPPLVGRDIAVAVLERAAERAVAGAVSLVVVTGPQGIGRSRLCSTVREAHAALGFCHAIEGSGQPERQSFLRPLRRALGEPRLEAVGHAVLAAVGAPAGREAFEAIIEAVEDALVETSLAWGPLLLVIDDAQWIDDGTAQLLSLLCDRATRNGAGRILVVVAIRDEPGLSSGLVRLLGQVERDVGAAATRLALSPLSDAEARGLVAGVAPVAPTVADRLVRGAGGLPFLLVQSLLAWEETGQLVWREGAWHPASSEVIERPPAGIADLVRARIASFFEPGSDAERVALQVLACAALAGSIAPAQLEAPLAALGNDPATVERALEALVEAGLLILREGRHEYGFAQPLLREAVGQALRSRPWRPRLQRALIEELARGPSAEDDAAFVARGYRELGDLPLADRWMARAIRHALDTGLFDQAVASAGELAEETADAQQKGRALLWAVEGLLRGGDAIAARERLGQSWAWLEGALAVEGRILALGIAHATGQATGDQGDLVARADATGDARLALEARLALARLVRGREGLGLLDDAIARLPGAGLAEARYRLFSERFVLLQELHSVDSLEVRAAIERACAEARALGSSWALLDAEIDWATVESALGHHDAAIARIRSVADRAAERRFATIHRTALLNATTMLLRAGRHEECARQALTAAGVMRGAASSSLLAKVLSVQADALHRLGRYEEAQTAIDEAIAIAEKANDPTVAISLLRRTALRRDRGELRAALVDARQALAHASRARLDDHVARARLWIALLHDDLGEPGAREALLALALDLRDAAMLPPTRALYETLRQRLMDGSGATP
jgi:hypothetical protein